MGVHSSLSSTQHELQLGWIKPQGNYLCSQFWHHSLSQQRGGVMFSWSQAQTLLSQTRTSSRSPRSEYICNLVIHTRAGTCSVHALSENEATKLQQVSSDHAWLFFFFFFSRSLETGWKLGQIFHRAANCTKRTTLPSFIPTLQRWKH